MILGEATGSALNCLSPTKRDEFLGRPEQALEESKYAAADEGNLALCRVINVLLSKWDHALPLFFTQIADTNYELVCTVLALCLFHGHG
jgi:hypothetical protein